MKDDYALDWLVYKLFGIDESIDGDMKFDGGLLPSLRPMELLLAQKDEDILLRIKENGESQEQPSGWFERHGWEAKIKVPESLPSEQCLRIQSRLKMISQNKSLRLLETPEYKRRWYKPDYKETLVSACEDWLLQVVEKRLQGEVSPISVKDLSIELSKLKRVQSIVCIYTGEAGSDLIPILERLILRDSMPYTIVYCFKEAGLEKRSVWEGTWDQQREEDKLLTEAEILISEATKLQAAGKTDEAAEKKAAANAKKAAAEELGRKIPVPPKYKSSDFLRSEYWKLRGKLDVPKERFISYPGAESENDNSPLIGWAGWDHAQRAQAIATLYQNRKNEDGWGKEKLTPLLAGLWELVPWLHQWHSEEQDIGSAYENFVNAQCEELEITTADLKAWRPAKKAKGKRKSAAPKKPRKPKLEAEKLISTIGELQGDKGADLKQLVEALSVGSSTISKLCTELISAGKLELSSKRPKRFKLKLDGGETEGSGLTP